MSDNRFRLRLSNRVPSRPRWWNDLSDDHRDLWRTFAPALVIAVAGFGLAWMYMAPAPPQKLTIAAGHHDGAYFRYCQQYAKCLKEHGVTLHVRETDGSVENYRLLQNDPDIDIAIVQAGTTPQDASGQGLESIASLYPEPLWIFFRDGIEIKDIRQLKGKRVAVGPDGSGTRCMAEEILAANGLDHSQQDYCPDTRSGYEAAAALRRGDIDVACFVTTPEAGYIRELIHTTDVKLLHLQRQKAYAQLHPWLQPITLAKGVVDLPRDLPSSDVPMIAPSASLVATPHLHHAFVPLFLQAAQQVHGGGGMFVRPGEFPNAQLVEHPLNASAADYFRHGPSLFHRYLPFWVVSLISRTRILLVPLLTLLIPLIRLTPPIYRWRIRSRIYRWYEVLRRIDQELAGSDAASARSTHRAELERMECELQEIKVPLSYMEEFYNLRLHLNLVSRRVYEQTSQRAA